MPAQVDSSAVEVLTVPQPRAMLDAQAVEVLWGSPGAPPVQEAAVYGQSVEILTTPSPVGHIFASVVETLWLDLTFQLEIDAQAVEVLWGSPGTPPIQEAALHSQAVELLTTAPPVGHILTSVTEVLGSYTRAVAGVEDIYGPTAVPAVFDGTTSIGLIQQYRWGWVSVPGGSTLANASTPFPDFGSTTPINMTANVLLYHAEETAGVTGADTSGSGNTANLTAITVGVLGKVGSYAWNYTGSTSKAQPINPTVIGTSWTVAFWFYNLAPNTAWRTGVRGTANHHIIVETGGDTLGLFQGGFQSAGFEMPSGSYTGWHHMVAVGTSLGDTHFYVDGNPVGTVVGFRPTDDLVTIGNYQGNGQRFADRIDEFATWTRELTPSEIKDLYVLQEGNFTGVGPTYTFTPDVEGLYTINLTVVDGVAGGLSADLGRAHISDGSILFPLQGDSIRMWSLLQGQPLRHRSEG